MEFTGVTYRKSRLPGCASGCSAGSVALLLILLIVGIAAYALLALPNVQERILLLGLTYQNPAVQGYCIEQLRAYPTWRTARALVVYVNSKVPRPRERMMELFQAASAAKGAPLSQAEIDTLQAQVDAEAAMDLGWANRALRTLCQLSGENFGSGFSRVENERAGEMCTVEQWPDVANQINVWAETKLGLAPGTIAAAAAALRAAEALPAVPPAGGPAND